MTEFVNVFAALNRHRWHGNKIESQSAFAFSISSQIQATIRRNRAYIPTLFVHTVTEFTPHVQPKKRPVGDPDESQRRQ
jgi:hypothetical protein